MVRSRTIPHYIQGNKVYFFEDELIKWVEKGRVATLQENIHQKKLLILNQYGTDTQRII